MLEGLEDELMERGVVKRSFALARQPISVLGEGTCRRQNFLCGLPTRLNQLRGLWRRFSNSISIDQSTNCYEPDHSRRSAAAYIEENPYLTIQRETSECRENRADALCSPPSRKLKASLTKKAAAATQRHCAYSSCSP